MDDQPSPEHRRPDGVLVHPVWIYAGLAWCRGHQCQCPGTVTEIDSPEARESHPDGRPGWLPTHEVWSATPSH